ncbi:MAG: enoyl-CoA hydratase-related protein [Pseudaminobacter sp.]
MTVELIKDGPVATVMLNRPEKLNALTEAMKDRLGSLFIELASDRATRVVVLAAAGKGFCASGDVATLGDFDVLSGRDRLKRVHRLIISLSNIEKPVIASVRGIVAGTGWSMAMASDMVIASETATFSQVFRNMGLAPDGGSIFFLTKLIGELRAKEMVYSGCKLPVMEAEKLGLVNRVVKDEDLETETMRVAHDLAEGPGLAYASAKKLFKLTNTPSLEAFLDAETWAQGVNMVSDDHREGVSAFREKRKADFQSR